MTPDQFEDLLFNAKSKGYMPLRLSLALSVKIYGFMASTKKPS